MYRDYLLPEVYKTRRPLHDDWGIWPFTLIPRRWTFYGFDMPPHKVCGNADYGLAELQDGYPLALDYEVVGGFLKTMHPVHPVGYWSIQSVSFKGRRYPCYFTMSAKVFNYRLHFNIGLKPDVTKGDYGWWFPEASFTFKKIV